MSVTVFARGKALPGCAEEMQAALLENAAESRKEATCLGYRVYSSGNGVFMTMEQWESKEAVDEHMKTPHVQLLFTKLAPLLAERPQIEVFREA